MLAPLSSLEAFRRDAVTLDGAGMDDATVATWLESATRLERAAMARGVERDRLLVGLLAQHRVVPFPATPVSAETVASTVGMVAKEMEDQAYLRLAHSTLASLLIVVPDEAVLVRGRVLAQQGRIVRRLGEIEAAKRYYAAVSQLGEEHNLPELVGRAWAGFGVLAQTRGDYPEARRLFTSVVDLPGAADESVAVAHQQLMVAAATAKDYDTATAHAWKAFQGASTTNQETEALFNLAQLLLDAGHARAALRGFAAALVRKPIPRFALPTLGGAACAAAAALPTPAARALVRNFAERVDGLVTNLGDGASLPYPSASALVEISEALSCVNEEEASRRIAARAETIARAHGFHQLVHRLENPTIVPAPAELAPETTAIISAVDELEGTELVGASA